MRLSDLPLGHIFWTIFTIEATVVVVALALLAGLFLAVHAPWFRAARRGESLFPEKGQRKLAAAIADHDVAGVRAALPGAGDLNLLHTRNLPHATALGNDETLLSFACRHADNSDASVEIVRLLLAAGANPNVPRGVPLAVALCQSAGVVETLLQRSPVHVFDPAVQERASQRLSLKTHLRAALEREAFTLDYQPIVALGTHELRGCEALIRWSHEGRAISPAEFVPLAEEASLIVPMGRWVLKEACRQARVWREEFPEQPIGIVHVNVSAMELVHPEFLANVDAIIGQSGLTHGDIIFELTESVAMQEPDRTVRIIAELQARGHRVAMDDFGTGYCSLSYFHRLSVDGLKIDRSFVQDIETSARALSAVRLILDMARSMEIEVVAEGVETAGQARLLHAAGCQLGQGFRFSRPVPPFQLRSRFLVKQTYATDYAWLRLDTRSPFKKS